MPLVNGEVALGIFTKNLDLLVWQTILYMQYNLNLQFMKHYFQTKKFFKQQINDKHSRHSNDQNNLQRSTLDYIKTFKVNNVQANQNIQAQQSESPFYNTNNRKQFSNPCYTKQIKFKASNKKNHFKIKVRLILMVRPYIGVTLENLTDKIEIEDIKTSLNNQITIYQQSLIQMKMQVIETIKICKLIHPSQMECLLKWEETKTNKIRKSTFNLKSLLKEIEDMFQIKVIFKGELLQNQSSLHTNSINTFIEQLKWVFFQKENTKNSNNYVGKLFEDINCGNSVPNAVDDQFIVNNYIQKVRQILIALSTNMTTWYKILIVKKPSFGDKSNIKDSQIDINYTTKKSKSSTNLENLSDSNVPNTLETVMMTIIINSIKNKKTKSIKLLK
ncbi:hypothetical protein ABPG72_008386 [Tetrahymena utriculariae]